MNMHGQNSKNTIDKFKCALIKEKRDEIKYPLNKVY